MSRKHKKASKIVTLPTPAAPKPPVMARITLTKAEAVAILTSFLGMLLNPPEGFIPTITVPLDRISVPQYPPVQAVK